MIQLTVLKVIECPAASFDASDEIQNAERAACDKLVPARLHFITDGQPTLFKIGYLMSTNCCSSSTDLMSISGPTFAATSEY